MLRAARNLVEDGYGPLKGLAQAYLEAVAREGRPVPPPAPERKTPKWYLDTYGTKNAAIRHMVHQEKIPRAEVGKFWNMFPSHVAAALGEYKPGLKSISKDGPPLKGNVVPGGPVAAEKLFGGAAKVIPSKRN